jgi:putative endopeptidase
VRGGTWPPPADGTAMTTDRYGVSVTHSGIVLTNIDPAVRPQDDLFRHVNGGWLATAEIPEDRPLEGSFTQLRDASEANVRDIIESADPAGSELEQKIGTLYRAFMDEAAVEARGLSPVKPMLERIHAVADAAALVELCGELGKGGTPGILAAFVNNDPGNPDRYLLWLYQSGLGLPDESYYREDSFAAIRTAYQEYLSGLLALAGEAEPAAQAAAVLDLETKLASFHLDAVSCRDPQKIYNLHDAAALTERAPFAAGLFSAMGLEGPHWQETVVCQPDFVSGAAGLLASEPLEHWKSWLAVRVLTHAAPYLSSDAVQAHFGFYGRTLSGTPVIKERWKRGVALVEGALGEAIGQIYVTRHFPPGHKARMEELVANLLEAYRRSITELPWMSAGTVERALEKLSRFTTKIGYPEKWIDYSGLQIVPGEVLGNVRRAEAFELKRQLDKLGGPIDRGEWHMTPQTVNAYYQPTMNEIVFPAAILQPPFFDAEADPAANYGAIGAVIGHEIGHGFDDQGSQFDGTGALHNWWTEEDRAAFEELTARLVEQYSVLSPEEAPENKVNGKLTLGENIGDLGGLGIAYLAYTISLDGQEPPVIDGLTGPQRFFYSWAECWRQKIRPEESVRRLTVDPHSPNEFRCNAVVRNLSEFHEAFGVAESDRLWLSPAERVRIW